MPDETFHRNRVSAPAMTLSSHAQHCDVMVIRYYVTMLHVKHMHHDNAHVTGATQTNHVTQHVSPHSKL